MEGSSAYYRRYRKETEMEGSIEKKPEVMVQVLEGGSGICVGEGTGVGAREIRQGPWVVVVYIFMRVERIVREKV